MRVLVVEDEKSVATFVKQVLEWDDYAVDVAYDGEQAELLVNGADFALVILDLVLPKVGGYEVLNHIRAQNPSLPVLIMSGWAGVEDRAKLLDLGASDCLAKLFAFGELSARVRALLTRPPGLTGIIRQVEEFRHRFERMKGFLGLPPTFGFLVEINARYPRGHSQAVSWLAMQIARQMGLPPARIEEIRVAGLVHDIGKIQVPLSILDKSAALTTEESEITKSHVTIGEKMLEPLKMKTVALIVRHHHERYDGKGYPDGSVGTEIPLGARIVAVAESFESMLSDLPYKGARTFEECLSELRSCCGTQFDPDVVMGFLNWLQIHGDPREHRSMTA
jgi:putative nucleotidyltransferase with HDIG domain